MEDESTDNRPLAGIRVFELGAAIAGPTCTRYLAHFGAEVIKVESRYNPDPLRLFGSGWLSPERFGRAVWMDSNPALNEHNAGKKALGLDLKKPEGQAVAKRLLSECDVFVSNFTVRAIRSLGLDYETVRTVKPDIIHVEMSGYGSAPGPYTNYLAWGKNLVALTGIDELTGWPDRPPVGITRIAYPDHSNSLYAFISVLAALDYRERTGEGQAIDLSQFGATAAFLGPQLLDYEVNGRCAERTGNRLPRAAPHGVYPSRGNDSWVAIGIFAEEEWRSLCRVAGHPEWAEDPRFCTLEARLEHQDELDPLIGAWTGLHTNVEVAEWLQKAGVPASPVLDYPALALDPQLAARDFWLLADSRRFGKDLFTGVPIQLSDTPGHVERAGPALGEDNDYVLSEICGYSGAEIEALVEKDVVHPMALPDLRLERPFALWLPHFMPLLPWPDSGVSGI